MIHDSKIVFQLYCSKNQNVENESDYLEKKIIIIIVVLIYIIRDCFCV